MSAQRLNAKNIRKIAAATGLPVIQAWGHGTYTHDFVTAGHLHGLYSLKTGEWRIQRRALHYDTCPEGSAGNGPDALFPNGVAPLTTAEALAVLDAKAAAPV